MSGLPLLGARRGGGAAAGAIGPLVDRPDLPERAVQFGTGALLRGLVDAIIDDANRAGHFNGRIVAIGSTGSGRDRDINRQDGMFTLLVRGGGTSNGAPVHERRIVSSVSRALSAAKDWNAVLECARNPALEVIFSNTTEVGIALDAADERAPAAVRVRGNGASHRTRVVAPRSFPAKLTRFLHERARAFDFASDRGVVVVPCELIERNGDTLRDLVFELAHRWSLEPAFVRWLKESVSFCNTLVDRIVPGAPSQVERARLTRELGYRDALLTVCEPYRLLAIEGNANLSRLGFARREFGVVVAADIAPYRERKVRLLNGGHTVVVSLALMAGCQTVRDAVEHDHVGRFLRRALLEELVPTVTARDGAVFAQEVLQRFANPYVDHRLQDITLHGGAKMRVRIVPAVLAYRDRVGGGRAPSSLALGFAAYLLHASGVTPHNRGASGTAIPDDVGAHIRRAWESLVMRSPSEDALVRFTHSVCGDATLWGTSLDCVVDFPAIVARHLVRLTRHGAIGAIESHLAEATIQSPSPALT